MNKALQYPFSAPPGPGSVTTIQPGVLWVRMTLPMKLDHINLYLLEDDAGWWIVDTGLRGEETRANWERVLAIDADHAAAHFNLGVLDMDYAERPATARKHLERYLQVVGGDGAFVGVAKERLALLDALAAPGDKAK